MAPAIRGSRFFGRNHQRAAAFSASPVSHASSSKRTMSVHPSRCECGCPPAPSVMGAWRHGFTLGVRCSLCCGTLMLALLAIGMMDLVAMAAVTLAIAVERFAPVSLQAARVTGVAILVVGVLTIVRI